jgi:RNA polymerase sigma-70 factor (ECF subfamily)
MDPGSTRQPLPRAFRLLYDAHFSFVVQRCGLHGVPRRNREDVAQEVFCTLHREIGRLDLDEPIRPWLAQVTMSRAIDWLRLAREREQPSEDAHADRVDMAPTPEEAMREEQMTERLRRHAERVLLGLPEELRTVLVMAEIDEMPMPEIAAALGIPEGTGKTRLRTAKRRAAEVWKRELTMPALMPFAFWNVEDLLRTQQAIPPAPPGVEAAVWGRLMRELGPGIAAGVTGASAGAAGAGALKVGVGAWAKSIVAGVVLAGTVGGAYLLGRDGVGPRSAPTVRAQPERRTASTAEGSLPRPVESAAPTTTPTLSAPAIQTASATVGSAHTGATGQTTDADDRAAIEAARAALMRDDVRAARAALARIKGKRFAAERAELQQSVDAYQKDGGP